MDDGELSAVLRRGLVDPQTNPTTLLNARTKQSTHRGVEHRVRLSLEVVSVRLEPITTFEGFKGSQHRPRDVDEKWVPLVGQHRTNAAT
ncbi:hypothetical protein D3C72_369100 [compost metagenome]